jgi:hypothetical protein
MQLTVANLLAGHRLQQQLAHRATPDDTNLKRRALRIV